MAHVGCMQPEFYMLYDFRHSDLGDEETEFCWIAWAGITCRDVVQHRDRHRIAGAIVDEPADVWIMIDAVEVSYMTVLGQDRLQKFEVEGDGSTSLGEDQVDRRGTAAIRRTLGTG